MKEKETVTRKDMHGGGVPEHALERERKERERLQAEWAAKLAKEKAEPEEPTDG